MKFNKENNPQTPVEQMQKRSILSNVKVYPSNILLFQCTQYHISAQLIIHAKNFVIKRSKTNFSQFNQSKDHSRYYYELKTTNKQAFKVSQSKGILEKTPHIINIYLTPNKSLHHMLRQQLKLQISDLNQTNYEPVTWKFKIAIQDNKNSKSDQANSRDYCFSSENGQSTINTVPSTLFTNIQNRSSIAQNNSILNKTLNRRFSTSEIVNQNLSNFNDRVKQGFTDSKVNQKQFDLQKFWAQKPNESSNKQNFESKLIKYKKMFSKQSAKERFIHSTKQLNLRKSKLDRAIQIKKNNQTKTRFKIYLAFFIFFFFAIFGMTCKNLKNQYFSESKLSDRKPQQFGYFTLFRKQATQKSYWL